MTPRAVGMVAAVGATCAVAASGGPPAAIALTGAGSVGVLWLMRVDRAELAVLAAVGTGALVLPTLPMTTGRGLAAAAAAVAALLVLTMAAQAPAGGTDPFRPSIRHMAAVLLPLALLGVGVLTWTATRAHLLGRDPAAMLLHVIAAATLLLMAIHAVDGEADDGVAAGVDQIPAADAGAMAHADTHGGAHADGEPKGAPTRA